MTAPTNLSEANKAFRSRLYTKSVSLYIKALLQNPGLFSFLCANLDLAKKKLLLSRQGSSSIKTAIVCLNLSQFDFSRIETLIRNLKKIDNTFEILNLNDAKPFIDISNSYVVRNIDIGNQYKMLFDFCLNSDYDQVVLLKPAIEQALMGFLYKSIWDADIFVDIPSTDEIYINNQLALLADFDFMITDTKEYAAQEGSYLITNDDSNNTITLEKKNNLFADYKKYFGLSGFFSDDIESCLDLISNRGKLSKPARLQSVYGIYEREENWIRSLDYESLNVQTVVESLFVFGNISIFLKNLFNLALNRNPQDHEAAHYGSLIANKKNSRLEIAEIVFYGEESKTYFQEKNNGGSHAIRKVQSFSIPKIGDLKAEELALPYFDHPEVSVLIPAYCKLEYTLGCIDSIVKNLPKVSFEVLVLDDRSPDNSVIELSKIKNLKVIVNSVNLRFLKSCNHGVNYALGKYIFFLNNDTQVKSGWLDSLLKTFSDFSDVGLVGSKLIYPNGLLQEAGGIVWNNGNAWNYGRNDDPSLPQYNYVKEVDYCSGAAILIERDFFRSIGSFDERYAPSYYEDNDLAFKVRAAGKKVLFQPKSEVIHFEGVSNGTDTSEGLKAYQVANSKKFHERWKDILEKEHLDDAKNVFFARERSANKTTVLVIDHYVPQPDRDAGSKSMWHIILTFIKQGLNVKFWPHNNHYDPIYSPWLESIGVEVIAGNHTVNQFKNWLIENGKYIDKILLSRPTVAPDYIDYLKKYSSSSLIYYGHDIHYLRIEQQYKITKDNILLKEIERVRDLEHKIWEDIDTIYYPSVDEENYIRDWCENRKLINKEIRTIPVYAYTNFIINPSDNLEARKGIIFVAGFSHTPNIDAAKWLVNEVLPLVNKNLTNFKITLVGSNPSQDIKDLASDSVVVTGFVTDEELEKIYINARLAIAPLLYGGGMKGKVIEAMKYGVPCITTSIGAQGLDLNECPLSVSDNASGFAKLIEDLYLNENTWTNLSNKSQKFVKKNFSSDRLWEIISSDFSGD
jgi:GT2 family glycosyltransferase/glycosyltransferase involved in cell wall biosynthesis